MTSLNRPPPPPKKNGERMAEERGSLSRGRRTGEGESLPKSLYNYGALLFTRCDSVYTMDTSLLTHSNIDLTVYI